MILNYPDLVIDEKNGVLRVGNKTVKLSTDKNEFEVLKREVTERNKQKAETLKLYENQRQQQIKFNQQLIKERYSQPTFSEA